MKLGGETAKEKVRTECSLAKVLLGWSIKCSNGGFLLGRSFGETTPSAQGISGASSPAVDFPVQALLTFDIKWQLERLLGVLIS